MKKENKNFNNLSSFNFTNGLSGINGKGGFTLVELIIVITILAILATIAFLSFKGYMKDARDGNRVASISNIEKGLGIFNLQTSKYPTPDKKDGQTLLQTGALSISGSIIEYSYLGEIGSGLTQQLKISKTPQDPLSGSKYTYTTTLDGRKYQIASILENPTSYKNNLVKQANAGNDGYVAKVSGNHQDIVIKEFGTGKYITVVPSLVFDPSGSNILNQTGTLSIVNNKGNLPYSPSKSSNVGNTTTAEQLIREVRNNNQATTATLKLPDGVTLDGSGVLNEWWIPNKNGTNWNTYSSGVILASLGSVGVDGGVDYTKLTDVLNGGSATITAQTMTSAVVTPTTPSYDIGNSLRFNGSNQYLTMTPNVVGNGKIGTIHTYFKGINDFIIMEAGSDSNNRTSLFLTSGSLYVYHVVGGVQKIFKTSSALFRDPSTWYDVVLTWDMPVVKLYVNGLEISSWQTSPNINTLTSSDTFFFNTKTTHNISKNIQGSIGYLNGYISDYINIDGQSLPPTAFGQFDSNGRWVPKSYTGSYGTNGFHLDFSSGTSLTSLGLDSSGKGNNWTLSPTFNTYDQMLDSPTNNFATLNPINKNSSMSLPQNGNLNLVGNPAGYYYNGLPSTVYVSTGMWYWETTIKGLYTTNGYIAIGAYRSDAKITVSPYFVNAADRAGSVSQLPGFSWDMSYQAIYYNTSMISKTRTGSVNDIIMMAMDLTNGKIYYGKNGFWFDSADPSLGTNPHISGVSGEFTPAFFGYTASDKLVVNFGQGGQTGLQYCSEAGGYFKYCPPTGFKALSTKNFPENYYPIENPKQYFDVLTYTGNGTSQSLTGLNFKPDLVWIKRRSGGNSHHVLQDSVRGTYKFLFSSSTDPENTNANADWFQSFNNDGFSVKYTSSGGVNTNEWNLVSTPYVAWNWRAGGTSVTNNDGTIESQVSANKEAGFSIVKYKGNGTAGATVGHLLGKIPSFIILKRTDNGTDNWRVYHSALGGTKALALNTTDGAGTNNIIWNNANPNDSTFTLGTESNTNASGSLIISYIWSEVPGFSKFGSYTGNGSTDGPFVYTGFKPRYIMIKSTANVVNTSWYIVDTARDSINPVVNALGTDITNSESTVNPSGAKLDILSNGFKVRVVSGFNSTNEKYIYAAFAELPFK